MSIVIGIDPGLSGALALLTLNHAQVFDMPLRQKGSGEGKIKNEIDPHALAELLLQLVPINPAIGKIGGDSRVTFIMERVGTMPGQGKNKNMAPCPVCNRGPQQSGAGAFSLGDTSGCIRGVLGALGYEPKWIGPVRWKNYWQITGEADQKNLARRKAVELYPELADALHLAKSHNKAEAVLIARWGWEQEVRR